MASLAYISSLLMLLVVAPQLSGIQVSQPGEITLSGIPTVSRTVDPGSELFLGQMLELVEGHLPGTVTGLPQLYLHGGLSCYFLPRQAGSIQLRLLAGLNGSSTKLLFRVDNLNLIGFSNQTDHWFALEDGKDLMPGATVLPFGANYSQLLGEGSRAENLAKLALGRAPALEAVRILGKASYPSSDPSGSASLRPLQLAVATLMVTVPESLRIIPMRTRVFQLWEEGTVGYLLEDDELGHHVAALVVLKPGPPTGEREGSSAQPNWYHDSNASTKCRGHCRLARGFRYGKSGGLLQ